MTVPGEDFASGGRRHRRPRVAVLWKGVTGYVQAELRALVDAGTDVWLVHQRPAADSPFDPRQVTAGVRSSCWTTDQPDVAILLCELEDFDPDAVVICGWDVRGYRKVARSLRGQTLRILMMDNQWWGTPKQWGGVAVSRFLIQPAFDATFLPADPQAAFARKLGFTDLEIMWGVNTCDHPRFAAIAERRGTDLPPEAFLFAGRLVHDKAVDVLADAYALYRQSVADPWPLKVAGTGPDAHLIHGRDGVEVLGFVQPAQMPDLLGHAGCLVVPSRFEPWAVVIHEAAAAGLPIVCTSVCGAASRLVLDGHNGHVVPPEDPAALAHGFGLVHRASDERRRAMGRASEELARQFTPERWAATLLERLPELRARVGLRPAPWLDATESVLR